MNETIEFECAVCFKTITWKPTMIVGEYSSFECSRYGQFYRCDDIDLETNRMQAVKVDREKAISTLREQGLL